MEKMIMDMKKKVESYSIPEGLEVIPPYASLKSSEEEFCNKYSSTVMAYTNVCDSLSSLQYIAYTVDRFLHELPNTNEVFSKQKYLSTELKYLKDETKSIIEAYQYYKEGLTAAVRFYQNFSYMRNSYRMPEF